jgi:hypothetical protein
MLVGVLGIVAGSAQAALITGGSFESPDIANGTNNVSDATGHVWSDGYTSADNNKTTSPQYGAGVEDPTTNLSGQLGDQYGKMLFAPSTTQNQWIKIYSPALDPVLASYTYTLTVGVGWDRQYASGSQPTWAGYNSIQLILSGNQIWKDLPSLTEDAFTDVSFEVVLDADGKLVSHTGSGGPAVGTLLTGGNASVSLMGGRAISTGSTGSSYLLFDNIRLDAVPEPAALSLLGIGALGVLGRRRRK